MAVDDSMLPLAEDGRLPQLHGEDGDVKKEKEVMQMETSPALIGLTKEQLEKYRNDPFWKPFRMFMFVLFWLVWIGMFVGAILIVVLSPKCAAKLEPEWWRTKVSYQIFTPSFRDSNGDGVGDFNGIKEKLDDIRKIGVQNVWVTPVITTQKDDFAPFDVVDFGQVDARFGTMEDFKSLVEEVHKRDMHLVMDLPISTTSVQHSWFKDAAKGDAEFRDYYLWKKAEEVKGDKSYVRLEGTTDAYLAYDSRDPVLNWHNEKVKNAIITIAKNYLDIGIDGFHVGYVNQLGKDTVAPSSNTKEALEALEYFRTQLESYTESSEALKEKKIAIFTSLDDMTEIQPQDTEEYNVGSIEYVIDDSGKSLNEANCASGVAKCVYDMLQKSLAHFARTKLPHVWQFSDYRVSRPASRFDVSTGNLLTFLQLTLPGAVELYYGQELGLTDTKNSTNAFTGAMQWDDSGHAGFSGISAAERLIFGTTDDYKQVNFKTEYGESHSPIKTFKTLAKLRQRDDCLLLGEVKLGALRNEVITFSRYHHDTATGTVYVVVANFAISDNTVDIKPLIPSSHNSDKAEVAAITANVDKYSLRQTIDLSKEQITLAPKQGILIKL